VITFVLYTKSFHFSSVYKNKLKKNGGIFMSEINVRKRGQKWQYQFEAAKIEGKGNKLQNQDSILKKKL
jgi:hypothetical protein